MSYDLAAAARCLRAFASGERDDDRQPTLDHEVGSLMVADTIRIFREVHTKK